MGGPGGEWLWGDSTGDTSLEEPWLWWLGICSEGGEVEWLSRGECSWDW